MRNWLARYTRWLHTRWPAGGVEPLPRVRADYSTNVPGVYVVGDLTGVPLLKYAAESGAAAVRTIAADLDARQARSGAAASTDVVDVAILGAGVAGASAALEARARGLRFELIEAAAPFATIANFPPAKPIFTYPTEMQPDTPLKVSATVKEGLFAELRGQLDAAGIHARSGRVTQVRRDSGALAVELESGEVLRAARVIIAIGRAGDFRRLGVPGEELPKVLNRLHDPAAFSARDALVVGGGDTALETAVALHDAGARVSLVHRGSEFVRPKPENRARLAAAAGVRVFLESRVRAIGAREVEISDADGHVRRQPNDVVFPMIGREAPLAFLRRSGVEIAGERTRRDWVAFGLFLAFCLLLYHWKANPPELPVGSLFQRFGWFPFNLRGWAEAAGSAGPLFHTLLISASAPGFWITLAYSLIVVVFGVRRMRRRPTPYVRFQTLTLMAIQCLPLFVLPEILLPWMGHNGWFDAGGGRAVADALFPQVAYGHGREYWRAYGFVLAFPLFVYNVFTGQAGPLWPWIAITLIQTCVLIPWLVYRWGKGAYCGWICSCGALAETLGDAHRDKMPHGPFWNRLNMLGQAILAAALLLLLLQVGGWLWPGSIFGAAHAALFDGIPVLNYRWQVDIMLAGVLGVGCYFWFSGRVWCRFACPLAALMHIYARFSKFRIFAEKKKCISCNVCTSVCHQGIDVMAFANKGLPMDDPQCVRCSACVSSCPTGVLSFGAVDRAGIVSLDRLVASAVRARELS